MCETTPFEEPRDELPHRECAAGCRKFICLHLSYKMSTEAGWPCTIHRLTSFSVAMADSCKVAAALIVISHYNRKKNRNGNIGGGLRNIVERSEIM